MHGSINVVVPAAELILCHLPTIIVPIILLLSMSSPIHPPRPQVNVSPTVTVVLIILLIIMFFLGFFSLCFCKCFIQNIINSLHNNRPSPNTTPVNPGATVDEPPGLDPLILKSFPTFQYSSVKDLRSEKYGLECAICLCEFQDEDFLRILTDCCHVFHQECIDLWLESHKTCPVCRRNLDAKSPEDKEISSPATAVVPARRRSTSDVNMQEILVDHEDRRDHENRGPIVDNDSYRINVMKDGDHCERASSFHSLVAAAGASCLDDSISGGDKKMFDEFEKFSRSHSTGHSLIVTSSSISISNSGDHHDQIVEDDKYTLRLPEHVKHNIFTRRHIQTLSCTTFGELSSGRGGTRHDCLGEVAASAVTGASATCEPQSCH